MSKNPVIPSDKINPSVNFTCNATDKIEIIPGLFKLNIRARVLLAHMSGLEAGYVEQVMAKCGRGILCGLVPYTFRQLAFD
jgi:hypothetical protein